MSQNIFKKLYQSITLSKSSGNKPNNYINPKDGVKQRAKYKVPVRPKRVSSFQIDDVKSAMTIAMNPTNPDRSRLLAIYDYTLLDGHVFSQKRTALMKVTGRAWGLYDGDTRDDEASKIIETRWFEDIVGYIVDAEFFGFSPIEITINGDIIDVELIPRENVNPDFGLIMLDGAIDGKVIEINGNELITNIILIYRKGNLGILHVAAFNSIYKFYDRGDWSRFNEKFGIPIMHMTVDTNSDDELDNAEAKAANFGSDGYIVTQKGDEVNVVERPQMGHNTFKEAIQLDDDENSKIINGQTATAEEKSFVGSSEVQERILQDYSFTRMRQVKFEVNSVILPFLRTKGISISENLVFDFAILKELEKRPQLETNQSNSQESAPATQTAPVKTKQSKLTKVF